jgi:asparagine synthase (glutamine-hydrolysing)
MEQAIRHRGPDGSGVWSDDSLGLGLSHRRLAIIDLTDTGAQPMVSASGRFVITYNGEIYNFARLRAELEASGWQDGWRGGSDTEVLLAAIEHWGLAATLPHLDGMFALGLWDRQSRQLSLARDRFGEKPLYYGFSGKTFLFGSELDALAAAAPQGLGAYDVRAIDYLVRSFCIPAPLSIYRAIAKLPPASFLTLGENDLNAGRVPEPQSYWSAFDVALSAAAEPFEGSYEQAVDQLHALMRDSIGRRLVADVPVGAMLSSGIDSTTICALAQSASSTPLRTFTVGVDDPAYNEAPHAAEIAKALGSDHTTIHVGAAEALAAVPEMARIYGEPFADSSQVITTLLSRALRGQVTVALSGDAGDELFGGYVRYRSAPRIWSRLRGIPHPLRQIGTGVVRGVGQDNLSGWIASLKGARGETAGRVHKALGLVDSRSDADLYARLLDVWPDWTRRVRDDRPVLPLDDGRLSFARRMMLADTAGYLPSDVLAKVDRASMSTALEVRVPFLDPEIFRFAWSLPDAFLFQDDKGKRPLRDIAERHVPAELLNRPKQGFAPPIGAWLRGPLKDWAADLIENQQVSDYGVIDAELIRRAWRSHLSGRFDESPRIWPVLMFEAWRREQPAQRIGAAA